MNKPLSGIKMVELSVMVAGPVCGRLMEDLGAEVIKLERAEGDGWRTTGKNHNLKRFSDEENPIFDVFNAGKRMLSLDLRTAEGQEIFHKLLSETDIFMSNMRPQSLKKMHVHYEDLCPKYPRLIYALGLGYGEKGPEADTPAYDTTAFWSRPGFLTDSRPEGSAEVVSAPSSMGDTFTGMNMTTEICAALFNRERTGKGCVVKSSLYHCGIYSQQIMMLLAQGEEGFAYPRKRLEKAPFHEAYMCKDGEFVYIALQDALKQLPQQYKLLGLDDMMQDKYLQMPERWDNREYIHQRLIEGYLKEDSTTWIEKARGTGLPITRMGHFCEIPQDEQAWANDYLEKVEYPNGHVEVVATTPVEIEGVEKAPMKPARRIGQDSEEILKELGYTQEQIDTLRKAGVITVK